MARRFWRGGVLALSAGVIVAVLGGCEVTGTPESAERTDRDVAQTQTSDASQSPSGDASRVKQLVLDTAPAGYTLAPIPEGKVQEVLDQLVNTTRGASVSPPACGDLEQLPKSIDASEFGLVVATSSSSLKSLSEAVTVRPVSIADIRAKASSLCKSYSVKFTSGELAGASSVSTATLVDPPQTKADPANVVVTREQSKVTLAGGTTSTDSVRLTGVASVKGYGVTVTATTPGAEPDTAAFNEMFTKAINKVVDEG